MKRIHTYLHTCTCTCRERDKAADGRRDKGMQFVTISEKWDKKAQTYTTPSVPYPFDSKETYERSIRQVCFCLVLCACTWNVLLCLHH